MGAQGAQELCVLVALPISSLLLLGTMAFLWGTLNKYSSLTLCDLCLSGFLFVCLCFVCIYVSTVCMCVIPTEARRGHWTSKNWSY